MRVEKHFDMGNTPFFVVVAEGLDDRQFIREYVKQREADKIPWLHSWGGIFDDSELGIYKSLSFGWISRRTLERCRPTLRLIVRRAVRQLARRAIALLERFI